MDERTAPKKFNIEIRKTHFMKLYGDKKTKQKKSRNEQIQHLNTKDETTEEKKGN